MVIFRYLFVILLGVLLSNGMLPAQTTGSITGTVLDQKTSEPLPFVNLQLLGTTLGAASDNAGNFTIGKVPPGTYILVASIIGHKKNETPGVVVRAGEATTLTISMVDEAARLNEVVVYGASMREERLTKAPSAVTVVEQADIQLASGSGQPAKLLETQPGVDIVQNGLNDFNVNTRGFNSSLNRRLLVLLDGRDLAIAFLGSQEWNGLSVPVEDLGRLELVRGPSSALYGANAFNGVINIQTPRPRDIIGTKVTLAGGEVNSFRFDIRHADESGPIAYKINVGRFQGETWNVTRKNLQWEYPGFSILNNEEVDLLTDRVASTYASARLDHDFSNGALSTIETGITQVENEVFVTGIGRVQVPKALKPWGRLSYSTDNWYIQLWSAGRESVEPQLSLSSGLPLDEHSFIHQVESQYRTPLLEDRLFSISGITGRYQTINTNGTLMKESRRDNALGIYEQLEYTLSPEVKTVGAIRLDMSTLHDAQVSPKLAVVWSPDANHSFRMTFNQAFQAPNLSELYLFVLRTAKNPNTGIPSHFAYHGNENLKVEKITGYEVGYKGIIANSFFITADAYYNILNNFITDLAPGVHPDYPEPVVLPGDTALRAIWSYNNAGKVTEQGIELGLNYYITDSWIIDANYAFFDFSVLEKSNKDILLPNAPKHKINGGITFKSMNNIDVNLSFKYVPGFDWAAGIYNGKIFEYTLVNAAATWKATPHIMLGVNISNLLDREHYEIFGGSLLRRRIIATVTTTF